MRLNNKLSLIGIVLFISLLHATSYGQNLMDMLDEETEKQSKPDYVTATFKTTRLINGHSVENVAKGVLDFRISHRFGF